MKNFVVNLKRRTDRKENIEKLFGSIEYEFFEAVDGKQLQGTPEIQKLFAGNDFMWRKGVIGCALSHYNLWKKLAEDTSDAYCIFEDDVFIPENFKNLLKECEKNIQDIDFLMLGYTMFNHIRSQVKDIYDTFSDNIKFDIFRKDLYIGGFFGYIITKNGAKKMLEYIEKNGIKHGIDYLIKIMPELKIMECQPHIVFSDWVDSRMSRVDSDIQKDYDYLAFPISTTLSTSSTQNFEIVEINGKKYKYYKGLDSSGNDIKFVGKLSIEQLAELSENEYNCISFNSLGFLKRKIDKIGTSPWIHPENDGLYVKIEMGEKKNKIRVKMLCNWCSSRQLCLEWNHMSKGNFIWNDIQITDSNEDIDYFVIINKPLNENEFYIPEKTIIFQMEPWCSDPKQHWGVKTWGKWARPDETKFLQVRTHDKFVNNGFWQLKTTYTEFKNQPIIKKDSNIISSICSSKYFDPGHIKRIDFLKYIESKNNSSVKLHIYNHDNQHNFKSYQGPHPVGNKDVGITPYKYYFMAENNCEKNFITEKIWEPLLTESLCFYWGCPNVKDYIDPEAFVLLDLNDFEKSFQLMKNAIENNLWEKRLPIIRKEKERVLEYYSFFPTLERIIKENDTEYNKYFAFLKDKKLEKVCFIHSCNLENIGTKVLDELLNEIDKNLKFDLIYINNIGKPLKGYEKENIHVNEFSSNHDLFELPTIKLISLFSKFNSNVKVLYLHTKGITHSNSSNVADWRRMLSYFMIEKNEKCLEALDKYDAVGCNYLPEPYKHFSGNFWWANSNYLKILETKNLKQKHDAEWWVLTSTENFFTIFHSNINHYHMPYPKHLYRN